MRLPDYNRSTLSITASLLKFFGAKADYPTLPEIDRALAEKDTRAVVVILYDGMGENLLRRALPPDAFLVKNDACAISAVFPSTTTAATTSLWTGLSPAEHGWLGWSLYFKEAGRTVDAFTNRDSFSGEPYAACNLAETYMPLTLMYEKLKGRAETHAVFPFRSYAARGVDHAHVAGDAQDAARIIQSVAREPGKKLIAYYDGEPDHTMHEKGVNSPETRQNFARLNRITEKLSRSLPDDALLIVTADHGLVDVTGEVNLNRLPALMETLEALPSVERRAASFFVKAHKKAQFEREFKAACGEDFLLFTHDEVFEKRLLGQGTVHPKADDFIGDYLAVATGTRYFGFSTPASREFHLIGQHAGLTDDEMTVPVILARNPK